ncbi:MAG: OmpH family outer membrane protein [Novosphingobium sp.]|nr:OmpH family outer membrane protein [Novosphingobium sp.]
MNILLKSVAAAALMASATVATPVMAQAAGTLIPGLAIANLDAVVVNSNAFKTAEQQRLTTYKAQLDRAEQRRSQLEAQLKPLAEKFEKDRTAASPNQQALAQQAANIQTLQSNGQQELQSILAPVAMSRAYVTEQIEEKLDQAIKNAMSKKKISLLIGPDAVLAMNNNGYNLNQDILNELNTLLPSAQLVPPAGWEPRQIREAKAAQAAQAGGQPAATSTQPTGR